MAAQSLTAIALDPVAAQGKAAGSGSHGGLSPAAAQMLPAPVQPYPPAASKWPHPPQESFSVTHPGGRGRSTNCFAHAVLQVVRCSACSLWESVTGTWAARYWPPYRGTLGDNFSRLFPALRRHHTDSVPSIVHARPFSLLCSLAPLPFASHGLRYSAFQIAQRHPPSNHRPAAPKKARYSLGTCGRFADGGMGLGGRSRKFFSWCSSLDRLTSHGAGAKWPAAPRTQCQKLSRQFLAFRKRDLALKQVGHLLRSKFCNKQEYAKLESCRLGFLRSKGNATPAQQAAACHCGGSHS